MCRSDSSGSDSNDSSEYLPQRPGQNTRSRKTKRPTSRASLRHAAGEVNYNEDAESDADDIAFERAQALKKRVAAAAVDNPDIELTQGDIVEKVLHHQYWENDQDNVVNRSSNGATAEDVLGREVAPHLDGHLKFLVKWKGWSHCHNTWASHASLLEFQNGDKTVRRYWKNWEQQKQEFDMWPDEEQEAHTLSRTMELELLQTHCNVERICAVREAVRPDAGDVEYLTKWEGLTYEEATWEGVEDVAHLWQGHIDEFNERQQRMKQGERNTTFSFRSRRGKEWRKMETQPPWLRNGQLREYQLEGINWLYYQWCKDINTILADGECRTLCAPGVKIMKFCCRAHVFQRWVWARLCKQQRSSPYCTMKGTFPGLSSWWYR